MEHHPESRSERALRDWYRDGGRVRVAPIAFVMLAPLLAVTALMGQVHAADWPFWLGLQYDGTFAETGWRKDWPESGPPRLFEIPVGIGYSSVAVADGNLILFHRIRNELHVDNLDPETGKRKWRYSYPTNFRDPYGYSAGPRCCPLIDLSTQPRRVFTLGSKGVLMALNLDTGEKLWGHELKREHNLPPNFFGVGAAPFLHGDRLYLNLGGTQRGSGLTFAFNKAAGTIAWKQPTGGGSYAAARIAKIDGADQLFIFHRTGMTCFDPADGRKRWEFPWMSRTHESVNAATPVIVDDIVFFSATYRTGGVALSVSKDSYELLWKDDLNSREKSLDTHWCTSIHVDGYLYGFSGRHEPGSTLRCVDLKTGKVEWSWESYLGRGALLYSDGHFIGLGERGDLTLLQLTPTGHKELRRVPDVLAYPAWTVPTVSNGLLYLRDEEKLICMDLRPTPKSAEKND